MVVEILVVLDNFAHQCIANFKQLAWVQQIYTHGKVLDFVCILEDFWLDNSFCSNLVLKVI